jgi:multisubunit Na+/H+ antiporter MnhG subunit
MHSFAARFAAILAAVALLAPVGAMVLSQAAQILA